MYHIALILKDQSHLADEASGTFTAGAKRIGGEDETDAGEKL